VALLDYTFETPRSFEITVLNMHLTQSGQRLLEWTQVQFAELPRPF
jgi:hypothetical protein